LEIGFKDRFEDQLKRALYDSIPDGRDSQGRLPSLSNHLRD